MGTITIVVLLPATPPAQCLSTMGFRSSLSVSPDFTISLVSARVCEKPDFPAADHLFAQVDNRNLFLAVRTQHNAVAGEYVVLLCLAVVQHGYELARLDVKALCLRDIQPVLGHVEPGMKAVNVFHFYQPVQNAWMPRRKRSAAQPRRARLCTQ